MSLAGATLPSRIQTAVAQAERPDGVRNCRLAQLRASAGASTPNPTTLKETP